MMLLTSDQVEMLTDMGLDLESLTEEEVAEILAEAGAAFEESEEAYEEQELQTVESGMTIEEALHAMPEGF
ncbi:MAG: hypothetical protein JNM99_10065 [Verrucomicrobiaceae bacterium]|nr:hypothetical protein [Verrucomicrobiaceae bacterium]